MDFRILGPLEVRDGDRTLDLGGVKQRSLLALLLLAHGRPVATARLIDDIWGERPPETARKSIQKYVSNLRDSLGAGRIRTIDRGYAVQLEPGELDLGRFEETARSAAAAPARRAAMELRHAFALVVRGRSPISATSRGRKRRSRGWTSCSS